MGKKEREATDDVVTQLRARRQYLIEDLKSVEQQIYDMEERDLEETAAYGNVVKGFDNFISARVPKHTALSAPMSSSRKRALGADRVFSLSSSSAPMVLAAMIYVLTGVD